MRKKIIKIGEKEYTLELNRESIKWLEQNGFVLEDFLKKPLTLIDLVWASLFRANHKDVNPSLAIKLQETYQQEGNSVTEIINFAIEEYGNFMNALTDTNLISTKKNKSEEIIMDENITI